MLILEAGRGEGRYWRDLWDYRELFAILAWRDVAVRYKQTAIGVAWALVRPLLSVVIFTVIFSRVAKLPSEGGAPYALMVFAGMLPWFLFSTILSEASGSLLANAALVGKVYFPRIILPSSAAAVAVVDSSVNLLAFFGMMVWYGYAPTWRLLLLPFLVVFAVASSLGPALLLAALNVKYRDFRYIVPFVVQFGLYISPVGFSSQVVPASLRLIYGLNPVVATIDGFRWCLLGGRTAISMTEILTGLSVTALFLVLGVAFFRSTERTFADVI